MYNSGFSAFVHGDLDVAALTAAMHLLCQRHEVSHKRLLCLLLSADTPCQWSKPVKTVIFIAYDRCCAPGCPRSSTGLSNACFPWHQRLKSCVLSTCLPPWLRMCSKTDVPQLLKVLAPCVSCSEPNSPKRSTGKRALLCATPIISFGCACRVDAAAAAGRLHEQAVQSAGRAADPHGGGLPMFVCVYCCKFAFAVGTGLTICTG